MQDAQLSLTYDQRMPLVRYLEVLIQVAKRVSTVESTSDSGKWDLPRGIIDKLSFQLPVPLSRSSLFAHLTKLNIPYFVKRLRDHRWYLQIGAEQRGTYIYLGHPDNAFLSKVVTNPGSYDDFAIYQDEIQLIFGVEMLNGAKISRIDLSVDLEVPLAKVLAGMDVKYKKANSEFATEFNGRTGLRLGANSEKIVVYDKGLELGQSALITRIECQLSGKKLPIRYFGEFGHLPERLSVVRPMENITLNDIRVDELDSNATKIQKERKHELATLIRHEGLVLAKIKLNSNNNFHRDYLPFLTIIPWKERPADILAKGVSSYFKRTC